MPSRRSRSRSRSRDRSESPERTSKHAVDLPGDASPISESDYFQKSDEFRLWLKEEKGKYFDSLSGDRARSYFRKFVKAWNRGKLARSYYDGIEPGSIPATTNTSYKWSFASKKTRAEDEALRAAREEVGAATYERHGRSKQHNDRDDSPGAPGPSRSSMGAGTSTGSGRVLGPAMPTSSDLTLARELASEQNDAERKHKRKRDKMEAKERMEDMVGPKPVGREGMLEAKRAKREGDRAFRERGDDGFVEMDEGTLMGGGDSFRDVMARRDKAQSRSNQKREEAQNAMRERTSAYKEKEKATMDMFQQLAKQRFG